MFVGRPLGLTLLQIRFFGIAAHDFAETPLYGQSFDGHFADGVDLGAHLADRLIVDAHGEGGVSGFRRRTLDVERQRCAAVGQFERGAGYRQPVAVAAGRAFHRNCLVAVGVGVGEPDAGFRRFALDEISVKRRCAVDDRSVGLCHRNRILYAVAFQVERCCAFGRAVVRGRNGDPFEFARTDALRRSRREPLGIFGYDRAPCAVATQRDALRRGQIARKLDDIGFANEVTPFVVLAPDGQYAITCGQQQGPFIDSFHGDIRGVWYVIIFPIRSSVPVRGCR